MVVHGDTVYLAGLVADDLSQGVRGQTEQILKKIDEYLAEAGSGRSKLLRVEIWLPNIATFDEMNAVYDAWIDQKNPPARACVEARLAGDKYLVEIMATAAR
jgi:enamine deaminase RidA (YjgF/YER057c/UK114 family)